MFPSLSPSATVLRLSSSSPCRRMVLQASRIVVAAVEGEDEEDIPDVPNRPNHLLPGLHTPM